MKKSLLLIMLAALLLLCSCGTRSSAVPDESSSFITPITGNSGILGDFTATDLNGNNVNESVLHGKKLTMVNVWATFCGPCINEMPDLGKLSKQYSDVQIIGIVSDTLNYDNSISKSQVAAAKDIVKKTGADYLHILPSKDIIPVIADFTAVPTTFFVDENGNKVGKTYVGSKSKKAWEDIIETTLKELN